MQLLRSSVFATWSRNRLVALASVAAVALAGCTLLPADGSREVSENLLTPDQAGFERSAGGWVAQGNTTIARTTAQAASGDASLRVTVDPSGPAPDSSRTARIGTLPGTNAVRVAPGTTYVGSVQVRGQGAPSPVRCELRFYGDDGRILGEVRGPTADAIAGQWSTRICDANAGSSARFVSLRVVFEDADYGEVHHVDDAQLVRVSKAPTTVPGSLNLLSADQASMEGSASGWVDQGNTSVSRTTDVASHGAASLRVRVDANARYRDDTPTARVGTSPGTKGVDVTAGVTYHGSASVRSAARPVDARCELRFYDQRGRILATVPGALLASSSDRWVDTSCAAPAPAGSVFGGLRVLFDGTERDDVFYVDDAYLGTAPPGSLPPPPPPNTTPPPPPSSSTSSTTTTTRPPVVPPPVSGDWPDASNTGPSGSLAASGSLTVTTPGAVIEDLKVTGTITVRAANVTIRNVEVNCNGARYGITSIPEQHPGLVVEDSYVHDCSGIGISGYAGFTVRRTEVSRSRDGIVFHGNNLVEDSWVHDPVNYTGEDHNDATQASSGSNITIRRNSLDGPYREQTAAIIIKNTFGPVNNVLIEDNKLSGGTYSLYVRSGGDPQGNPSNVVIRDNTWVRGTWKFGTHSIDKGAGFQASGNRYDDGTPLTI